MRRSRIPVPRWTQSGWRGGDSHRLFTFTDRQTGRRVVHPGNQGLRHSAIPVGPSASVRPATRAEGEQFWQSPLHAGWKVVD